MESRPLPHTKFLNTLMDVDFVVNSSISEGFAAIVGSEDRKVTNSYLKHGLQRRSFSQETIREIKR